MQDTMHTHSHTPAHPGVIYVNQYTTSWKLENLKKTPTDMGKHAQNLCTDIKQWQLSGEDVELIRKAKRYTTEDTFLCRAY